MNSTVGEEYPMDMAVDALSGASADPGFELLHVDALRFFPQLVRQLGGDPEALARRVRVDPAIFSRRSPSLGYRTVAGLLELAARELARPDFGMRLATLQGGGRVFGPMGVAMENSNTLGEALEFVVDHIHAYSLAARMRLQPEPGRLRLFVPFDILLDRLTSKQQAIEQALLLAHLNAMQITGGRARVREVRFAHQPLSPLRTYRDHFGCEVKFDQPVDGVVFGEQDLRCPIIDPDVQLYEMAASFIESRFTRVTPPMHARVRGIVLQHLGGEACTNERVAAELCLHPRTLHRRLKAEGKSFEGIKDEARRDVALRYLQQTDMPLTRIAERLGYAETSVLSRSCFRWFGVPPSRLRASLGAQDRRAAS
jgi:AraC-like DNA-binding protein